MWCFTICIKNITYIILFVIIHLIVLNFINSYVDSQKRINSLEKELKEIYSHQKNLADDIKKDLPFKNENNLKNIINDVMKFNKNNCKDSEQEKFDFAAEKNGGSIVDIDGTKPFFKNYFFDVIFGRCKIVPKIVIQQSISPGECFAFEGTSGSIAIRMMGKVFISSISIGHIPLNMSPWKNIDNAPKDFSVWGMKDATDRQPHNLGKFTYELGSGKNFQTFSVQNFEDTGKSYQYIRFNFTSNHGNPNETCVYRIRVYGFMTK